MGGCFVKVTGSTKSEVEKKVNKSIQEAKELGLSDVRAKVIKFNKTEWIGFLWVHS